MKTLTLVALLFAGCTDPCVDPCDVDRGPPPHAGNAGTLPALGRFDRWDLEWRCLENCEIATWGMPENTYLETEKTALIWWGPGSEAISERTPVSLVDGCWRIAPNKDECRAAFYVCPTTDRGVQAEVDWYMFRFDVHQRWSFTGVKRIPPS